MRPLAWWRGVMALLALHKSAQDTEREREGRTDSGLPIAELKFVLYE